MHSGNGGRLLVLALALLPAVAAAGPVAGEVVDLRGEIAEDLYVAGRSVTFDGRAAGDVLAAGRDVRVAGTVAGDVMAAGERVEIAAAVADDARLAGRDVRVAGSVGDGLLAAGETVILSAGAEVGGRAWLAGRRIELSGDLARGVRAAGETVIVSGRVTGDAEFAAGRVEVRAGAEITGNLVVRGPEPPRVEPGARIGGRVEHLPGESPAEVSGPPSLAALPWLFAPALAVAGGLWLLLAPGFAVAAARTARTQTGLSLALGLALLATPPLVAVLLMATVVGALAGLVLFALYPVMVLLGGLNGALSLGGLVLARVRRGAAAGGGGIRFVALLTGIVALALLAWIPLLGGLLVLAIAVTGLGALGLSAWSARAGGAAPPAAPDVV